MIIHWRGAREESKLWSRSNRGCPEQGLSRGGDGPLPLARPTTHPPVHPPGGPDGARGSLDLYVFLLQRTSGIFWGWWPIISFKYIAIPCVSPRLYELCKSY